MKRINACASDAQLSFDLSNSLLTPSFHNSHLRNKFKLTPIAVACVCALCSLSANAARDTPEDFKSGLTDIQRNALEQIAGQDTGNNRWTIGGEIDLSKIDVDFQNNPKANDLIGFFREDDYNKNDLARVNITYQDGVKWYHIAGDKEGEDVSGKITHPNTVVYFNKGDNTTAWDVRYDFADDGNDDLKNPNTQDTSVLSFFDNEKISANVLSDLKIYIFEPQVNLISQNHLVGQNNSANSKADIGLSLSNKRKNITFNKEVNFISSFTFYDEGTDNIPVSGVNNAKIAAGIYNAFGASDLESDISAEALKMARTNGQRLHVEDRAQWLCGDLFEKVTGAFDLIVSNPPYIRSAEIEELQEEVRLYDPRIALDGAEDGLLFYRRIIEESKSYLKNGGRLLFEIGCDQGRDVAELLENAGYTEVSVKKDLAGLDRVAAGRLQ